MEYCKDTKLLIPNCSCTKCYVNNFTQYLVAMAKSNDWQIHYEENGMPRFLNDQQ